MTARTKGRLLLLIPATLLAVAMWFLASAAFGLQCPPSPGPFGSSALSSDGRYLVCLVDAAVPSKYELYAVDGVRDPWRMSPGMADDRDVIRFAISPDSQRVAFTCDRLTWTEYDLWTAPIVGGAPVQISQHNLPTEHDVDDFLWASRRVAWRQGRNTTGFWQLFSSAGTGGGAMLLSDYTNVQRGFTVLDGQRVRYSADPLNLGAFLWFTVDAGALVFADGFENGNQGGWR